MFDCPATSAQRDTMIDEFGLFCSRQLLVALTNCAMYCHHDIRNKTQQLGRCISPTDVWDRKGVCRVVSKSIAAYLVHC
jgi:hypothetical protein